MFIKFIAKNVVSTFEMHYKAKKEQFNLIISVKNRSKSLKSSNASLKMYTEDTPVFERSKVELELPERLYSNTFTTVSKLSKIIGKFLKIDHKRVKRAETKATSYPDDIPEFDRGNVSLDFPDELFNKSFATLTNVSKSISRFIMNSARRYARFVLFFKPIFGDALWVQGFENPTTTTTTTTAAPNDSLNEI